MRYYRLIDDVNVAGQWQLGEVTTAGCGLVNFLSGELIAHEIHAQVSVIRAGEPPSFCIACFGVPLANRNLASAMLSVAGGDLQLVPIMVNDCELFEVLNTRRLIDCLDETRSQFVKWTERDHRAGMAGSYRQVTRLVIDDRIIPANTHIFRVQRWPIALIVSEEMRGIMERTGCSGAGFEDV